MKHLKKHLLLVILLISVMRLASQVGTCQQYKSAKNMASIYYSAENLRSDTFDILKYTINADLTDFVTDTIRCYTTVKFRPKLNGQNKIRLDLLKMFIDSVKLNASKLTYTYNDTIVKVNLPVSYNTTDTVNITLFYHGRPQGDPSGWGGFYFIGNYAFNLGVGFGAKPHNYGRVWFPCFDNFVEKSKYEFSITTDSTKRAYCNGQLLSDVKTGNMRTRTWDMQQEIPTYLASIAVADYKQVSWTHSISTGTIPIILAARGPDTTALKNGFVNLKNCITGFENYFGPYKWNRVGYCLVPFNNGAMEHATNIAYPQVATSIAYEASLMAHEFSHHWWGDLMTCETQEDMWLNEGFASYSEYLFREWQYGKPAYMAALRPMHEDMLHYAHFRETKFWGVSGVPHQYTYGDHVYRKGAVVAHTLRSYMGDAAFFTGIKYVMAQKSYKNMNSDEFRILLETSSGQSLSNFFTDWVFNGGWPHFSIDSTKYTMVGPGNYIATVHVKQKITGAPAYFTNVPLEISFFDSNWQPTVRSITMSGANQTFTMSLPFAPLFAVSNYDTKIGDAIAADNGIYKANGNYSKALGKCIIAITNKGADSSFIRVEHNYTAPDPIKNNIKNYKISNQHYWRFDGVLSPGFVSKLHLNFDGNMTTSGNYGALDTCLTKTQNDSIVVLYRRNAADDWKLVDKYTKYKTGVTAGKFIIDTLRLGEYAFANKNGASSIGIKSSEKTTAQLKVYPNPASNNITVLLENYNFTGGEHVEIRSVEGKLVYSGVMNGTETIIDCSSFAKGNYLVGIYKGKKSITTQKLILQ
jgi:aminopeptidase N